MALHERADGPLDHHPPVQGPLELGHDELVAPRRHRTAEQALQDQR